MSFAYIAMALSVDAKRSWHFWKRKHCPHSTAALETIVSCQDRLRPPPRPMLQLPSILLMKEVGSIDAPLSDCYICVDVDGPFVAVKDMRGLTDETQLMMTTKKKVTTSLANYHPPEVLPRWQLLIL